MKITCPICPIVVKHLKEYILDFKEIFTSRFVTERYYLHFLVSLVLTMLSVWVLREYFYLADTHYLFQIFVGGFGAFAVNYVREWNYARLGAPFCITDVRMGSYGGILATIILLLL